MGFFDRLFGRKPTPPIAVPPHRAGRETAYAPSTDDEMALARYRYMLRTAPPEDIEEAHREAFERLTPDQRAMVLKGLGDGVPAGERPLSDDPADLARAATRAEYRRPGTMERTFGGQAFGGGGMGMMGGGMGGGMGMMGGLMTGIAGGFIGSSIANIFFNQPHHAAGFDNFANNGGGSENYDAAAPMDGGTADQGAVDGLGDPADAPVDSMGDPADAGWDGNVLGVDTGYDAGGDTGGDFGGGDFGGGDFGGGDF